MFNKQDGKQSGKTGTKKEASCGDGDVKKENVVYYVDVLIIVFVMPYGISGGGIKKYEGLLSLWIWCQG